MKSRRKDKSVGYERKTVNQQKIGEMPRERVPLVRMWPLPTAS